MRAYTHCLRPKFRFNAKRLGHALAVLGLSFSAAVHALTIGHARVESRADERLQMSVLLSGVHADAREQLTVSLAPQAAWHDVGLRPLPEVLAAQIEIAAGPRPNTVMVRFYGAAPVEQSVIDLLFDVQFRGAQQRHQVSVLQQPRPIVDLPAAGSVSPATATASAPPAKGPDFLTVQAGDTLHGIARRLGIASEHEYQFLAAVYQLNPHAFGHNMMHLLFAGEQLRMPTTAQIQALSEQQARRLYAEHTQRFNLYKEALARGASSQEIRALLQPALPNQKLPAATQVDKPTVQNGQGSAAPLFVHQDRLRLDDDEQTSSHTHGADEQRAREKNIAYVREDIDKLEAEIEALSQALQDSRQGVEPPVEHGGTAQSEDAQPSPSGKLHHTARNLNHLDAQKDTSMDASWIEKNFLPLMLALLAFIIVFIVWILRRANKTTVQLESPDRVTDEMIQAKLEDINLDLDVPPSDEARDKNKSK